MTRTVLHLDLRQFCLTLERRRRPELRRRPVVIVSGAEKSVIMAASPEADKEGIRPGMPTSQARRRCRRLQCIPPDFHLYQQAQLRVLQFLSRFSPLVETSSWGQYFIDISGTHRLWGAALDTAERIRQLLAEHFCLQAAAGLATNKLVSKVAARLVRLRELCDVFPGVEAVFLAPLEVNLLPGVGEITAARLLHDLNLRLIGEVAATPLPLLQAVFGADARHLQRMAQGEDQSPVTRPTAVMTIRREAIFPEGEHSPSLLCGHLYGLVEALGRELRERNRCPGSLGLTVTYADGVLVRRRRHLNPAGSEFFLDSILNKVAVELLQAAVQRRVRVRRLTLSAHDLRPPLGQLSLFPWDQHQRHKEASLLRALDQIRSRYGMEAIFYGRTSTGRLPPPPIFAGPATSPEKESLPMN